MNIYVEDFFTSGHKFNEAESDSKSKFQMLNNAILLSSVSLAFGIFGNIMNNTPNIIPSELLLIAINTALMLYLRKDKNVFSFVSKVITAQYSLLFLILFYIYEPNDLKHIWLFTYPIILLYFDNMKNGFYWLMFMIIMLVVSPFQPYIETHYSLFQVVYISFVLVLVSVIMYFYKSKMDEAKNLILKQQNELQNFNTELELNVEQKVSQLQELNDSLEIKVQDKIKQLMTKDRLLTAQSKQAVMGEMISMIAHQWRQPLSTITLNISNLHLKRLLGEEVSQEESDKVLSDISSTIMYLSGTIDDFQTYFRPNKEQETIIVYDLIQKAINFALPRTKDLDIEIVNEKKKDIELHIYVSELIQVILNLINNSIDAFVEIDKQDAKLSLYAVEKEDSVIIYVQDNAHGIPDEHLASVFEPYFSTKGKNGTGLGLYMSQMIVEKQFGGEIRIETSENGTTFIVEIAKSIK